MKQQTAVEWLYSQITFNGLDDPDGEIFDKAKQMEKEQQQIITDKVTRFEVIDHTSEKLGRILVRYGVSVEVSIQDDGRTMKVFLTDKTNEQ